MAIQRIIIVPRWGGTGENDWYPALLDRVGNGREIVVSPLLPDRGAPTIQPTVAALLDALGEDPAALAGTLVIGHSVGCQTVLRAAADLDGAKTFPAALLVAAWFTLDPDKAAWPPFQPWLDTPVDCDAARRTCDHWRVILSNDDPYTADYTANRATWEQRLGADVRVVEGAKHFNAADEPAVFAALDSMLG